MKKPVKWRLPEMITGLYLALLATVFLLSFSGYTTLPVTKQSFFYAICGGYLIVTAAVLLEGMLVGLFSPRDLWNKIKPASPVQGAMLLYMAVTFLSAAFSAYPQAAWLGGSRGEGALTIAIYCLCFFFVAKFARLKGVLIYLFGGALTLFSVLSVIQLLGYNPLGLFPEGYNFYDAGRAYSGAYLGTLGNVDLVASFLCVAIPVLWIYLLRGKEKQRFLLLIPLGLALYVLVKMNVMAGFVGILGGAVLSVPFAVPLPKKGRILYWCGLAGCAVGGVVLLYAVTPSGGMLRQIHEILHGNVSVYFGSGRFYIWKNVLSRLPEHLLLGAGPDTLAYADIQPFQRYDEALEMTIKAYVDTAHNEYLNVLYHQGIFAFLLYLAGLISALLRWIKAAPRNAGAAVCGGAVIAYAVQAFFGISQFITAPFFWAALGLLEHYCSIQSTDT